MFQDRKEAGQKLAKKLREFAGSSTVVLALPRGGVVLGVEVAKELKAPLDVAMVRKIGHPLYVEYAIGAVAESEAPVYNKIELGAVDKKWTEKVEKDARNLMKSRRELYFGKNKKPINVTGKTVILVDDGIATGLTMKAAVLAIRNKKAKKIIVAVPVAAEDSIAMLKAMADEVVVLADPKAFLGAVGSHYKIFSQVDDEEVKALFESINNKEGSK